MHGLKILTSKASEIPCHIKITPTKNKDNEHIGYCGVTTPLKDKTPDEVRPKISFFTKVFKWMVIMRLPFLSATFVPIFAGAAVATILFLGGWAGPWPVPPEIWFLLKVCRRFY